MELLAKMNITIVSTKRERQHAEKLKTAKPNSIAVKKPELLDIWDWDTNERLGRDPYQLTVGMNRIASWICPDYGVEHTYDRAIDSQCKSRSGCPYCSGRRVLPGFNDLATTHPHLVKEWVRAIDGDHTPTTVTRGSHLKALWRCSIHGTKWVALIQDRADGKGCKECRRDKISAMRSRVKPGNSLAEKYPEVAASWDYELNDKTPYEVSAHARESAWWVCHEHGEPYKWYAPIYTRTGKLKCGCPKCKWDKINKAHMTPKKGQSLGDMYPDSLLEWAQDLNGDVTPFDVKYGAQRPFFWRCSICNDYVWEALPYNRIKDGSFVLGCWNCRMSGPNNPYRVPHGGGYLKDTRPDLAAEFDEEKNLKDLGITIDTIATYSGLDVWWRCPEGHSYHTTVNHRATRGDGCGICAVRSHVSFPEKAIFHYIKRVFNDAKDNAHPKIGKLGAMEFDIWIKSKKVAIEYDGEYWHRDAERDCRKDEICEKNGIHLIRVREPGCAIYDSSATFVNRESKYGYSSLNKAISDVFKAMGTAYHPDIDTQKDEHLIRKLISLPTSEVDMFEQLRLFDYDV